MHASTAGVHLLPLCHADTPLPAAPWTTCRLRADTLLPAAPWTMCRLRVVSNYSRARVGGMLRAGLKMVCVAEVRRGGLCCCSDTATAATAAFRVVSGGVLRVGAERGVSVRQWGWGTPLQWLPAYLLLPACSNNTTTHHHALVLKSQLEASVLARHTGRPPACHCGRQCMSSLHRFRKPWLSRCCCSSNCTSHQQRQCG